MESNLPARLEPSGELRVQARAGQYTLKLAGLYAQPPEALTRAKQALPWPARDIWAWAPQPALRQVDLEGAANIDPSRTNLPAEWRSLEAFTMAESDTLKFHTTRRGEPDPPPNALELGRTLLARHGRKGLHRAVISSAAR